MKSFLPQDPSERDIMILLAACTILPLEKRLLLEALPQMTNEEKQKLRKNLQHELIAQIKESENMTKLFAEALALKA